VEPPAPGGGKWQAFVYGIQRLTASQVYHLRLQLLGDSQIARIKKRLPETEQPFRIL